MKQARKVRVPDLPIEQMMQGHVGVDAELDRFFASGGDQRSLVEQLNAHCKARFSSFPSGRVRGTLPKLMKRVEDFSTCLVPVLAHAIQSADMDLFEFALARGADVEYGEERGAPPIVLAADALATNTSAVAHNGSGAVDAATAGLRADIARRQMAALIGAGADVNLADADGGTALMRCSRASELEGMRELIEAGARVNACDKHGNTALHFAVVIWIEGVHADGIYRSALDAVDLLLRHGADPNARTFIGSTPLHHFVWHRPDIPACWAREFVSRLVGAGAKLEIRDSAGHTPLLASITSDMQRVNLTATEALLDAGANIAATDRAGVGIDKLGKPEMQRLVRALLTSRAIEGAMGESEGVQSGPRSNGFTL